MAFSAQKRTSIDCIIPAFNEGARLGPVLEQILRSRCIRHVFVVDDGSDVRIDPPMHPKLRVLRHPRNLGKAAAVRTGLNLVTTGRVLLMDADMIRVTPSWIDALITYAVTARLDMLIGRCQQTLPTTRMFGFDVYFSGIRVVRAEHIKSALSGRSVYGYQIEPALNQLLGHDGFRLAFTDVPFVQYRKKDKYGVLKGLWLDLAAVRQVAAYRGYFDLARQIATFKPPYVRLDQTVA